MRTNVYICFNGGSFDYVFNTTISEFVKTWNNQVNGCGFFSGFDAENKFIVINPSNCGLIEFSNKK
jgi:hypothetical protein